MGDSIKRKQLRQERREQGVCILCGERKPRENSETCEECYKIRSEYQKKNKEKFKQYNKAARERLRNEVINAYGGYCICCKEDKPEFLTLDHKNKDGKQHRDEIGQSSYVLYLWAKRNKYPDTLQLYCFNCNLASAIYGECPHKIYERQKENTD